MNTEALITAISDSESRISRLIKQAEKIPSIAKLVVRQGEVNKIDFSLADNRIVSATALVGDRDSGILSILFKKGDVFLPHDHDAWELLLVLKGEFLITCQNEVKKCCAKEFVVVEDGIAHGLEALTDGSILAVTIPKAEGFPDVLQK